MRATTKMCIWFSWVVTCSPASAAKAPLPAKAVTARCAGNFPDFLVQFENSVAFQSRHTRFPVHFTYIDGSANPEPETHSVKVVSPADASYESIVFPSPATQARTGLQRDLIPHAAGAKLIKLYKPDTDYLVSYFFVKSGDCWKLAKVNNASL